MAQLTDDCFAFSGPLLPIAEMERLIAERVTPVAEIEEVGLGAALGRVVAADVVAPDRDTSLIIVDRAMAGHGAVHALGAGQAIRIFTGAPMPSGADTVFMQEDCRVEADAVVVPPGLERGANSRSAGEDIGRASRAAAISGRRS